MLDVGRGGRLTPMVEDHCKEVVDDRRGCRKRNGSGVEGKCAMMKFSLVQPGSALRNASADPYSTARIYHHNAFGENLQ